MGKRYLAWIYTSSTDCGGLREYGREYGIVSGTCGSVQFDAASFPLGAVFFSSSPVAANVPARLLIP